jgi:hypothetical protein
MNDIQKLLLVAGLMTTAAAVVASDHDKTGSGNGKLSSGHYTSRSYFQSIGFFESGTYLYDALARPAMMGANKDECAWGTALRIVPFGGKLTDKGSRHMGEYFGINHKRTLVASDTLNPTMESLLVAGADIDSRHFNIRTSDLLFNSTIEFRPKQTVFGAGLDWKQGFVFHEDDSVRYWFELNAPVLHVKSKMNLKETINTQGTLIATTGLDASPTVANMVDAFKQTNWKYGKIDNSKKMDKTRLADLEFKLGYNGVLTDCCTYASYIGVIFPTGNKPKGEYMFEPVVGNGQHFGISWGSNIAYTLWCGDESKFGVRIDFDSRYLFKKAQYRSFDLIGKQWSRYMEMYASLTDAQTAATALAPFSGTSGINLMTRKVDVTPRLHVNINSAFIYEGCNFVAEGGWTFYARHAEKIRPNWTNGPVLKSIFGEGYMTSARTIRDPNTMTELEPNQLGLRVLGTGSTTQGKEYLNWTAASTGVAPNTNVAEKLYLLAAPTANEEQTFVPSAVPPLVPPTVAVIPFPVLGAGNLADPAAGDTLNIRVFNDPALATQYIQHFGEYPSDGANGQSNYDTLSIKVTDIDWESGAMPAVIANTIYGTIGYNWGDCCYPTILSVGAAWDFTYGNAAGNRWTVFGQLGVSF